MGRRIAAVTGAMVVAAGLMAGAAQATFPGENGEIAFTRDGSLYAGSGAGEHLLATPPPARSLSSASYSADGQSVVYVACCGLGHGAINFVGADGSNPFDAQLEGTGPTFSPAGDRIAFASSTSQPTPGLYTTLLDGSDRQGLGDFGDPDWSPDGTALAATNADGGDYDVFAVPVDGAPAQRLTESGADEYQPSWSPDGTRIAFTRSSSDGASIVTIDADGSNEATVTGDGYGPVWSPDGTRIMFVRDAGDGTPNTWVAAPDGSDATIVLRGARGVAWQPAAGQLPLPQPIPDPDPQPGPPEPPKGNHKPRCSTVGLTTHRLPWRPDGVMYPVRLTGGKDPDGDRVKLAVTWIAQDERVIGRGEPVAPDAARTRDPRIVLLRNERLRRGDGRVYYIEFALTDKWGARCVGARYVRVRRWRHKPALASKPVFESLAMPRLPDGS
jgi:dipeptidyl aminopeptidase/acylaminoacyl peptidase